MTALGNAARSTVSQFAGSMGLTARENSDGSYGFDFSDSGRLSVTQSTEGQSVLVSLTRRTILDGVVPLARLMSVAGAMPDGRVVQAGLTATMQPVLVIAVDERSFDLPTLDRALVDLRRLHDGIGF